MLLLSAENTHSCEHPVACSKPCTTPYIHFVLCYIDDILGQGHSFEVIFALKVIWPRWSSPAWPIPQIMQLSPYRMESNIKKGHQDWASLWILETAKSAPCSRFNRTKIFLNHQKWTQLSVLRTHSDVDFGSNLRISLWVRGYSIIIGTFHATQQAAISQWCNVNYGAFIALHWHSHVLEHVHNIDTMRWVKLLLSVIWSVMWIRCSLK